MEITFDQTGNIPQEVSAEQIRMVRESFGDRLHVGAGTVMTETQRKLATAAGAEYIISPNVNVEIIRATKAAGLLSIPGAFTPFEIITAYEAGSFRLTVSTRIISRQSAHQSTTSRCWQLVV